MYNIKQNELNILYICFQSRVNGIFLYAEFLHKKLLKWVSASFIK